MKMLVAIVILSYMRSASGYSGGPPLSACEGMTPNHGATADPSTPPFSITTSRDTYYRGQEITVTVTANDEAVPFKGFFIQARTNGSTEPVGTFITGTETGIKLSSCGAGTGNAMSHNSAAEKTSKSFVWSNDGGATVYFQATFVNNLTTFWTGVESDTLTEVNTTETSTVPTTTESESSSHSASTGLLFILLTSLTCLLLQ